MWENERLTRLTTRETSINSSIPARIMDRFSDHGMSEQAELSKHGAIFELSLIQLDDLRYLDMVHGSSTSTNLASGKRLHNYVWCSIGKDLHIPLDHISTQCMVDLPGKQPLKYGTSPYSMNKYPRFLYISMARGYRFDHG